MTENELSSSENRGKIPTTFIPLVPEKLAIDGKGIDLLFGVFHIMWSDMPSRRTYAIRLCDTISNDGSYLGSELVSSFPKDVVFSFKYQ